MNNEKETISKEEAAATLKSIDSTKRDAIQSFRIPLLLITLISLSCSLVVFSWGMTEHDNLWALGMYIGSASFGIFVAFYLYTFRLLGIKVNILPRSKERIKSELVLLLIFAVILIFGRQFRVYEGFEYAPHIAALIAGGYMAYLLYKYPTGEYSTAKKYND
jgi:membrane associated rhomboid family serine protease